MKKKQLIFRTLILGLAVSITGSFTENSPAAELSHYTIERRAVETVIWGMPAVPGSEHE